MAYTNASKVPVVLDTNKISQMTAEINSILDKPKPDNWFFKWFSRQKIQSDTIRVQALEKYIEAVRSANLSQQALNAKEQANPKIIEEILLGDLQRARLLREKELAEHDDYLQKLKDDQAGRRLILEQKIAEVDGELLKNQITESQVRLLNKIIDEIDVNNISASMAFAIGKILNPMGETATDFATREAMADSLIEQVKTETEKKKQEAVSLKAKAELESFNTQMTKKEFGCD